MLRKFALRWLVNFLGLWAAAQLMSGSINYGSKLTTLIAAALIFSLVNAFVRPLIILLSLPAILFTLGLFTFVINAFMLFLVTKVYPSFHLRSFWTAIIAVVIVWVVNYLLNDLLEPKHAKSV
jgi:putative membrane protein